MTAPQLTRRRNPNRAEEAWLVFYGVVEIGGISVRAGLPHDQDQWG
ncbi:hypothetical protein [Bradyrhizobium cosmicum]|nr:hypothetical protein [Bradyrhizobium cosmicum]